MKTRVKSLQQLHELALKKKSVYLANSKGAHGQPARFPAAFVMSMQARCVLFYINRGLFVYKKQGKK